ncbi:unnamed protein product [Rhizophagus irregularis]|uniref:Uncharacterized protein n=1 Tax=Rhizophagus irregularis TaxID=588596 RepID=A0A915Z2Z9_9GLOM|nr:unnamed protein product [Rhizophagus irregularis]CAB4493505.1 unnamed protein product [Rhizophagus irregularis]CAB5171882.1 unnamed protein product [Rhizophagus irregularis]CAB5358783.1 unnamed protein product [Rhizophagus irregularis]
MVVEDLFLPKKQVLFLLTHENDSKLHDFFVFLMRFFTDICNFMSCSFIKIIESRENLLFCSFTKTEINKEEYRRCILLY